jgi:hypothetical protein
MEFPIYYIYFQLWSDHAAMHQVPRSTCIIENWRLLNHRLEHVTSNNRIKKVKTNKSNIRHLAVYVTDHWWREIHWRLLNGKLEHHWDRMIFAFHVSDNSLRNMEDKEENCDDCYENYLGALRSYDSLEEIQRQPTAICAQIITHLTHLTHFSYRVTHFGSRRWEKYHLKQI